jgi:hypothetical protein
MILSRDQLCAAVLAGGVPPVAWFGGCIQGSQFSSVSREWVADVWKAALESLHVNAPQLIEVRQIGGGVSRVVPRYVLNGFCCRGHGLLAYAHGMTGFALMGAGAGLPFDALAFGFLHYTATPRAENLNRNGRHENLWFIDHQGTFQSFEPGDGEENEMTPEEVQSITFLYAQ